MRPSALVASVCKWRRAPCSQACRWTTTPAAGFPRAVSSTWVEKRDMLSFEPQAETAVGRTRLGEDADLVAALRDGVPGAVVGFQMHFGDRGNFGQHLRADLIDELLDAARFEGGE